MPYWAQIILVLISTGTLGGLITRAFAWSELREGSFHKIIGDLRVVIGKLETRIDGMDREIQKLRDEKHTILNQLNRAQLERDMLEAKCKDMQDEVNELCRRLHMDLRYPDPNVKPA